MAAALLALLLLSFVWGRYDVPLSEVVRILLSRLFPVEQTWTEAAKQIKSVVEKVVFPALDMILAIAFFVKLGGAYFDYRQRGQFEWTGPAILFACLIFSLIAPKYIWNIIGI